MSCMFVNASIVPSSNFVDFIHCASRICLGQNFKALIWRWRQICPLKTNIFTLNALIPINEVSMFKLSIISFHSFFHFIYLRRVALQQVDFQGTLQ